MPQKGIQPLWLKGKGGRPKGSVGKLKRQAWEGLHAQLDALEFNALDTAVKLIKSRRCPISEKTRLICQILSLQFPRVQAIQHSVQTRRVVSVELRERVMRDPELVRALERAVFLVEARPEERPAGLLPAPSGEVIDAEVCDEPGGASREA